MKSAAPVLAPMAALTGPGPQTLPRATLDARQIRFVAEPSPGDEVIAVFREPQRSAAVSQAIDAALLPKGESTEAPTDCVYVCFAPGGPSTSSDELRRLDEWITEG